MQKVFTLVASGLMLAATTHAQDKLNLRNGSTLDVKVTEVGTREIVYKRFDNPNGPSYRVVRSSVESIRYENGTTEEFGRSSTAAQESKPGLTYGPNTLSVAPIQFTDVSVRALGIYYERAVGNGGIVALRLPVVLNFPTQNNNRGYTGMFTTLYPGVNFYPKGFDGPVRYAIGPSLALGIGRRNFIFSNPWGQVQYEQNDVFYYGLMVNNSLNINAGEHLYMGAELGLGMKYNNENQYHNSYYYSESPILVNFNFRIGYRF
jgi:hypothetical protein